MAKILVCDDDREIVDAIEIYLLQEGFEVIKAFDGIEAIEALKSNDVQLLIIDVMMPRMDGIHAILKIRESLDDRLHQLNDNINAYAEKHAADMATTFTGILIIPQLKHMLTAHVGDSRLYRITERR